MEVKLDSQSVGIQPLLNHIITSIRSPMIIQWLPTSLNRYFILLSVSPPQFCAFHNALISQQWWEGLRLLRFKLLWSNSVSTLLRKGFDMPLWWSMLCIYSLYVCGTSKKVTNISMNRNQVITRIYVVLLLTICARNGPWLYGQTELHFKGLWNQISTTVKGAVQLKFINIMTFLYP